MKETDVEKEVEEERSKRKGKQSQIIVLISY
jgi:hypothetical protein